MLCSTSSPQFSSLMCAKKIQKLLLRTIKCQVEFEYLLNARIIICHMHSSLLKICNHPFKHIFFVVVLAIIPIQ